MAKKLVIFTVMWGLLIFLDLFFFVGAHLSWSVAELTLVWWQEHLIKALLVSYIISAFTVIVFVK